MGGTRTLNGSQVALAFDLEGCDSVQSATRLPGLSGNCCCSPSAADRRQRSLRNGIGGDVLVLAVARCGLHRLREQHNGNAAATELSSMATHCRSLLRWRLRNPNPSVPSDDGLSLVPYTGSDAGQLSVNCELNKLTRNVTFGHGLHAGIHWRSDSDDSMLLGGAFAISVLHDNAQTYNEKFTVSFAKLDGTTVTISNP